MFTGVIDIILDKELTDVHNTSLVFGSRFIDYNNSG